MNHRTPGLLPTNSSKYASAASPSALAALLRHVRYEGDCWIWFGAKNAAGYGVATVNKQNVYVHRLTHWIVRGAVADGLVLDHLCRNHSCVNPLHTEAVTSLENTRRGVGNGSRKACPKGHTYDGETLRVHVDKSGYARRYCVPCNKDRSKARRELLSTTSS